MSVVGYATMPVLPEVAKNFRAELDRQTAAQFTAAGRRGGQAYGDAAAREAGSRIRSKFSGIFREAAAPAAGILAGTGLVEGLRSVVDAGSDAQQAVGSVQAVFKKYANEVIRDSKRAEQGLGLSRTAYQELITISGALLKNKGLTNFADQAENLIQIGADLAAQYGGSTKDAVEALNAALRGESDPIERYAISLNETAVNAALAANGQNKLTGAALELAKTQARLTIITQQSADAQGAFRREADSQAAVAQRTTAQWQNMAAELGQNLLPATQAFTGFLNRDALPALNTTGGIVKDVVQAFDDLPGPVKQVTAGFLALKAAQAVGITGALSAGARGAAGAFGGLRQRTIAATEAFNAARAGAIELSGNVGRFVPPAGRATSAMRGLRAGAAGLGTGLATLGRTAGAAAIALGALEILNRLQPDEAAIGRYVEKLQALAGPDIPAQIKSLTKELEKQKELAGKAFGPTFSVFGTKVSPFEFGSDWKDANVKVDQLKERLAELRHQQTLNKIESERQAAANEKQAAVMSTLANRYSQARVAVQALLDKENERRNRLLGRQGDRLSLAEGLTAARKEAQDGARTLDINTEAGQANKRALLDLASTWAGVSDAVKRSKGTYAGFRADFIAVARSMGASKTQAEKLANQLLQLPSNKAIEVQTPGMDAALAKTRALREELRRANLIRIQVFANQAAKNRDELQRKAGGGPIWGPGTKTSDSVPIMASVGEYMQPASAVDYYGLAFMEAVRRRQLPRFADGGSIGGARAGGTATVVTPTGQEIRGTLRFERDGTVFIEGVAQAVYDAGARSSAQSRRMGALDGIRRRSR